MKGTWPGCLDPTPVQPSDSSLLRLLGCYREAGRNKVGTDSLPFPLTSCRCCVGAESICRPLPVVSVGMTYPWSVSRLLGFFCHRVYYRRSSKVLSIWSLWVIYLTYSVLCIRGRKDENSLCGVSLRDACFCA